jgi:hypothetical protein
LSDFTISSITGELETSLVNYSWNVTNPLVDSITTQANGNLFITRPASYPIFAEQIYVALFVMDGVDDSGVILRAFFPIPPASSRSVLHSYNGIATVIGMRIMCAAPHAYDFELDTTPHNQTLFIALSALSTNVTAPELGTFGSSTSNWQLNCTVTGRPDPNLNASE